MLSQLSFKLFTVFIVISASTIQHEFSNRGCVDLQCPALVFTHGVKNFDSLNEERCKTCEQCTDNGYSVCMKLRNSRARRAVEEDVKQCSCMHSVPLRCQQNQDRIVVDATMRSYTVCYHDSLQIPPPPEAVNETSSVIATVEPFWHEPYWRDLELDNLTLHYDFIIKVPEYCDGDVVSSEYGEHLCKMTENMGPMKLSKDDDEKDMDYEQSDNYDQYDDQLPPEVEIPFEIFAGAEEVSIYYTISVNKHRQMQFEKNSVNISRNTSTQIESEVLKFKIKGLTTGVNLPQTSTTADEDISTQDDDDEDMSEEYEAGSNFFEDRKVKNTEELMNKKEVEESHKNEATDGGIAIKNDAIDQKDLSEKSKKFEQQIEEIEENERSVEVTTVKEYTTFENDGEETMSIELPHDKKDEENITEELDDSNEDVEKDKEKEEELEDEQQNKGDNESIDDQADENVKHTELDVEQENVNLKSENTEGDHSEKEDVNGTPTNGGKEIIEDLPFMGRFMRDKYHLARWVFGVTISLCFLLIVCTCLYRRGCCCEQENTKTLANGYRYNNPNRTVELVSPEKEQLHQ